MYEIYEFYLVYQDKVWVFMLGIIVWFLMCGVKVPYKMLTSKLVPAEHRKTANKGLILIAFGLGILAQYIYSVITRSVINVTEGIAIGTASLSLYAVIERGHKNKPVISVEEAQLGEDIITKATNDILADGKITEDDIKSGVSAVDKFFKEVDKK